MYKIRILQYLNRYVNLRSPKNQNKEIKKFPDHFHNGDDNFLLKRTNKQLEKKTTNKHIFDIKIYIGYISVFFLELKLNKSVLLLFHLLN